MLTKTTESAIKALILNPGLSEAREPRSPRAIATHLGESPSYMAKILGMLVKANILRAHKGMLGGVTLSRAAETITLLEIVECCQGQVVADYCEETPHLNYACAFHHVMRQVHYMVTETFKSWTLQDLVARSRPEGPLAGKVGCRLANVQEVKAVNP